MGRTGRAGDKEGVAYTLLLGKKDAHFAGLLVNSLSLGGQEVPRDLHNLAMNVSTGLWRGLCVFVRGQASGCGCCLWVTA